MTWSHKRQRTDLQYFGDREHRERLEIFLPARGALIDVVSTEGGVMLNPLRFGRPDRRRPGWITEATEGAEQSGQLHPSSRGREPVISSPPGP